MEAPRKAYSSRSARRGEAYVVDAEQQQGNLVKVKTPKNLTLVGLPANQTGFKVLRSDNEGETPVNTPNVLRRTRRSDVSPVLRLTFPEGTEEAAVADALKNYGMAGYRVENVEGVFVATRADLKSISTDNTTEIRLNDQGLTATVTRQAQSAANPGDKPFVAVAAFEFSGTDFTLEEVQRWTAEKSVDGEVQEPENEGDCYVVRRSAIPENEETRRLVLDNGVTAIVIRADVADIPEGFVAVVSETAYGNWGWGQLDFAAKLADKVFSEQMDEAIYSLRSVLNEILLYSALPLDVRKELVMRALAQYGEYVSSVMDSLPRQLLVSVTRSATPLKENPMSKETSGAAPNQAAATPTPAQPEVLTRADVEAMIATAVASLKAPEPTPAAPAAAAPTEPAKTDISRSDIVAAVTEGLKPLAERLTALEGSTVLRSAPAVEDATKVEDKKPKDVFRGALPGIRPRNSQPNA